MSRSRVIPGFKLSLGFTVFYLSLVVLLPLSALLFRSATLGWTQFWKTITSPWVVSAARFTLGVSVLAAAINVVFGLLVAWVLARYSFPGRKIVDAIIDLPFALPTAVAGIALTFLYSDHGWIGKAVAGMGITYPWPVWRGFDASWWPIQWKMYTGISMAPMGVVVALTFVGLPFVVRTVQPVLEDLSKDVEEAARSLGAGRWQTFRQVILPQIRPALLTGFALALARGLGEYGSVIFISGNRPDTEIASQVMIKMIEVNETDKLADATAVALLLLVMSFVILLGINLLQRRWAKRGGAV